MGLDQSHRDWQERMERKKGRKGKKRHRKVAGLSMLTSLSSWFGMCMALLGGALLMLIRDVCSMVKLHDVTVLTETRTSDASRLLQHLPGFTVHNIQLDRGNEGKNGHRIAVLVAPSCSDHVCVL